MCSVAIAVSPLISLVSSAAATTQLTDTGAALVMGAGDISAPALLRHKISLTTGTVIVLSGVSIEVPSCGAAKICGRARVHLNNRESGDFLWPYYTIIFTSSWKMGSDLGLVILPALVLVLLRKNIKEI